MTHMMIVVFLLVFGAFGLWGQQQEDRDAQERRERRARVEAEWKKDRDRVAAESAVVQAQMQATLEDSLAKQEATLKDSIARQEAAVQQSLSRNNTWGGGGRGGPLYHMPQDGAVAIGERVSPANDILETGIGCVERLTEKKIDPKEAQAYCKDITREAMKTSGNVSRSARKAVKAPPILIPRYGW